MHLTTRQRKILKWVGYPLLAIITFVFTLAYTFPYDRLKDKIIEGLSEKYDVSIMSIEPSLVPGTFTIETMLLVTRPKTPDEKPVRVLIDEIEVDVGVISALFWTVDIAKIGVDIEARIAGGSLGLEIEHDKGNNTISLSANTKMLPIASMPGVQEAVGLPMTGGLSAEVDVTLPKGKWSKADGLVKLSCIGCTVGDGVAKMKMKPLPNAKSNSRTRRRKIFAGDGITVPKLNLGAVLGEIKIKKGKGDITSFAAKSKDGFLNMEGEITFKDPFKETLFPGCMKFGFSEELKAREPKFMGIEAGLPPKAKQEDGSYAIPTKGKLVELRFDVRRQCGEKGGSKSAPSKRSRPKITTNAKDAKTVEPRKTPEIPEPKTDGEDDAAKDDSTESGPRIGRGIRDLKSDAEALSGKDSDTVARDEDEAGEDEGEVGEDEPEEEDEEEDEDADDEEEGDDEEGDEVVD